MATAAAPRAQGGTLLVEPKVDFDGFRVPVGSDRRTHPVLDQRGNRQPLPGQHQVLHG